MTDTLEIASSSGDIDPATAAFYRDVLEALTAAGAPFLVGGAYALGACTGVKRDTKDLDLFIRRADYPGVAQVLDRAGHATELTYPHWLAKVRDNGELIDLIFNSGNGVARVDDEWFTHAIDAEMLGVPVKLPPVEEMIWSKAFIMERERYDGADVAHLIHHCAGRIDWQRLLWRFGPHWRVLLSHLVLYGFIYPPQRNHVPAWLMDHLVELLRNETHGAAPPDKVCGGTLLSREQYLDDVERQGWRDSRLVPRGGMTEDDVSVWTQAIPEDRRPSGGG
jgi:predicted nucleotidyltransferase